MATRTRERILESSAELFRRNGYTGTGMKQVAAQAEAPFGSVYHHFPGGKEQLGAETIRLAGSYYQDLVAGVMAAEPDPVSAVEACFAGAAQTLRDTDYADACPIATVALEVASTSEPLRKATAEVFDGWLEWASKGFELAGIPAKRARELAFMMLGLLEGGFLFSRAMRSTESLEIAGAQMAAAVRDALPSPGG
jgi:AcrR family transcriptional regulator